MGVPWTVTLPEARSGDRPGWCRVYDAEGWLVAVIDPVSRERKPITESHRIRLRPAVKAGR